MPDGNIRCYKSHKKDKGGVAEWMISNINNAASTITKIFLIYETE